jgi:hypothetical protein
VSALTPQKSLTNFSRIRPWAAFRIVHFPGMDDLEAAGELGAWARRNGVGVDFQERKVRIGGTLHDVLYVLFAAS